MKKNIVLCGYGNVGYEFVKLVDEKHEILKRDYDVDLCITAVSASQAAVVDYNGIDLKKLSSFGKGSQGIRDYCGQIGCKAFEGPVFHGDIMVECTPTDIKCGEPALSNIKRAAASCMDIVLVSKGALINNFDFLMQLNKNKTIKIKYSGAAAAALPTIDTIMYSLRGASIKSIRGILNGTTNYILTRMHDEETSFEVALCEARKRGIAETNSNFDIMGYDSAAKTVILANTVFKSGSSINDVKISGIEKVTLQDIKHAKSKGNKLKLVALAQKSGTTVEMKVDVEEISSDSILYNINGTNKALVINTDTMGEIAVSGGASNPRGAAAAALKDILNICC